MDNKAGYLEHMYSKMLTDEPGVKDLRETKRYQSYLELLSNNYNILAKTEIGYLWHPQFSKRLKVLAGRNAREVSDTVIESAIAEFINENDRLSEALPPEQTYFYSELAKLAVRDGAANLARMHARKEKLEDALWRITVREVPDYIMNRDFFMHWT